MHTLSCRLVGACYNFDSKDESVPPPAAVQSSPNCGGVPNCLIPVRTIKFSFVFQDKGTDGEPIRNKIFYEIKLSPQAPYLARIQSECRQGIVPIDSKLKVYAKLCDQTSNFSYGK